MTASGKGEDAFDHGIGPAEVASIQREQFVYFLDLERRLADSADWAAFRLRLVGALTAAWISTAATRPSSCGMSSSASPSDVPCTCSTTSTRTTDPVVHWAPRG